MQLAHTLRRFVLVFEPPDWSFGSTEYRRRRRLLRRRSRPGRSRPVASRMCWCQQRRCYPTAAPPDQGPARQRSTCPMRLRGETGNSQELLPVRPGCFRPTVAGCCRSWRSTRSRTGNRTTTPRARRSRWTGRCPSSKRGGAL